MVAMYENKSEKNFTSNITACYISNIVAFLKLVKMKV